MTENDLKYRQGRSKKQLETSYKVTTIGCIGFLTVLVVMIIYGIVS